MKLAISALVVVLALSLACSDGDPAPAPTATPAAPTATPPPDVEVPLPVHLTWDAGELIESPDAGVFWIDIATGEAEAWVTPNSADNPFAFSLSARSNDASRLIYSCMRSTTEGLAQCGGAFGDPIVSYLLDIETGARTQLDAFGFDRGLLDGYGRQIISLSPDGETLLGIGNAHPLVRTRVADPTQLETITLTDTFGARPFSFEWAPGSDAALVYLGGDGQTPTQVLLLRNDADAPIELVRSNATGLWSPDGSTVAVIDTLNPAISMFDEHGELLWTRPDRPTGTTNVRWSPDGSSLAFAINPGGQSGIPERIEVIDAETGEPRLRINAALACGGQIWNADGSRLLFGSYEHDGRVVIADPDARTFSAPLAWYGVTPNPADPNLAVLFDGAGPNRAIFAEVDLRTGERTRTIATTDESPGWYSDHEPLFAGDRIFFAAPHLGHGGCGEGGSGVTDKPPTSFEFPPDP